VRAGSLRFTYFAAIAVAFGAVGCGNSEDPEPTSRARATDAQTSVETGPASDGAATPSDGTLPVRPDGGTVGDASVADASALACREDFQQWMGEVGGVVFSWGATSKLFAPAPNTIWQLRAVGSTGGFVAMQGSEVANVFTSSTSVGKSYAFHGVLVQPPAEPDGGGVYCIGAGTLTVDALKSFSIAVERISRMGSCPGTPVTGELRFCTAPFGSCPREMTGTVDGLPVQVNGFNFDRASLGSDEYLVSERTIAIRFKHVAREPSFAGGLFWSPPDGAFGGAVYCASEGSFLEEPTTVTIDDAAVPDSKFTYMFRGFSKIGTCQAGSGQPSSLRACMRAGN
jgi:hypothetical protein